MAIVRVSLSQLNEQQPKTSTKRHCPGEKSASQNKCTTTICLFCFVDERLARVYLLRLMEYLEGAQRQFCIWLSKISVPCSEKMLPRIFYHLRKAKNFQITVPFIHNFRRLSNKFSMIFLRLTFYISLLGLGNFLQKRRNIKFLYSKM